MNQNRINQAKHLLVNSLGDARKFCEICVKDFTFTSRAFSLLSLEEQQQIVEGMQREMKDTWFFNFHYKETLKYCYRFASRVYNEKKNLLNAVSTANNSASQFVYNPSTKLNDRSSESDIVERAELTKNRHQSVQEPEQHKQDEYIQNQQEQTTCLLDKKRN